MSTNRAAYIDGLRKFADVLESHPEVPLPSTGSSTPLSIWFHGMDARENLATSARMFPCDWHKNAWEGEGGKAYFELKGSLAGLSIDLTAFREAVCTKVVTGTHEVTEKVKDPAALAAVPEVEVTRTVEDVEWQCHPILADDQS